MTWVKVSELETDGGSIKASELARTEKEVNEMGNIEVTTKEMMIEGETETRREEKAKSELTQELFGIGEFEKGKKKNVGSTWAKSGFTGDNSFKLDEEGKISGEQKTSGMSKGTTHLSEDVNVKDGGVSSSGIARLTVGDPESETGGNVLRSYNRKNGDETKIDLEAGSDQGNSFRTGLWHGKDGEAQVPYKKNWSKTDGRGYTETDFDRNSEADWEWKSSHRSYKRGNIPTEVKSWAKTWVV